MKLIRSLAYFFASLLVPIIIIIISIRVLVSPLFYQVEYRMPYFPNDVYGFTQADRLKGAELSIDYLMNDASLDYFNQFLLTDGSPFYNSRELSHMLDVKILLKNAFVLWFVLLGLFVALGLWARSAHDLRSYWKALSRGGLLTLILILIVLVFVALSFSELFTQFHQLFFTGDTFLFAYSDTLIRLFPMQFWQDAFIWMGSLSILQGLAIYLLGRKWSKTIPS